MEWQNTKGVFGSSISITHISISITHNSKMVGPIARSLFGITITLFPLLNSQFSVSITQWHFCKTLHGGIHCQTLAATFDHLFFFLLSSLGLVHAFLHLLFFLFPFTVGGFFFFLLIWVSFFSFSFFFFFFFHWVRWSDLGFFFFFTGFGDIGKKKKKLHQVTSMGPRNSVKNIKWWQVNDGAKRVGILSDEWWMTEIEWWKKGIQTPPKY